MPKKKTSSPSRRVRAPKIKGSPKRPKAGPPPTPKSAESPQGHKTLLKPFSFEGWEYQIPPLGLAESIAKKAEESGHPEQASPWRILMDRPEVDAKRQYDECERHAIASINLLLARAEKFDGPHLALVKILHTLLEGLHALMANGNELLGRCLMNAISGAVNDFTRLAFSKPELFREWAATGFGIPGIISPNKEKTEDNQRLVELLGVGKEFPLTILPSGKRGRKWEFQSAANGLAVRLQSYIATARDCHGIHKAQAQQSGRDLPEWLKDAMELEPFSPSTWRAWANVAWKVLAEISPEGKPGRNPAFYTPATQICYVRKKRRQPFPKKPKPTYRLAGGADRDERFLNYVESLPLAGDYPIHECFSIAEGDIKEALFAAFKIIATGASRRSNRQPKSTPDK